MASNNYIEEFFIAIGFDTKRVKKEAGEVNKILEDLSKKRKDAGIGDQRQIVKTGKMKFTQHQKDMKMNDMLLKSQWKQAEAVKQTETSKRASIDRTTNALNRQAAALARGIKRGSGYQGLREKGKLGDFDKRIDKAVINRDVEGLKDLRTAISRTNRAMGKLTRTQVGLHTVQNGLTDSTRNMIRTYASVFALFQGTVAIKRIGQEFQGMNAAMLAVNGTAEAAAVDMQFLDNMVNEMGLNLKNTTDAYVKFKFAAKGKIPQTEIEDLFTSLSMFGTSLKVLPVDMQRAQRAIAQINGLLI